MRAIDIDKWYFSEKELMEDMKLERKLDKVDRELPGYCRLLLTRIPAVTKGLFLSVEILI